MRDSLMNIIYDRTHRLDIFGVALLLLVIGELSPVTVAIWITLQEFGVSFARSLRIVLWQKQQKSNVICNSFKKFLYITCDILWYFCNHCSNIFQSGLVFYIRLSRIIDVQTESQGKMKLLNNLLFTSWSTYCKRYVHPVKSDGSSLTAFQYFSSSGNVFFFGDAGLISCLSPVSVSLDKATFFAGASSLFSDVGELGSYSPSAFNLRLAKGTRNM